MAEKIGLLIDKLWKKREAKKKLADEVTILNKEMEEIVHKVLDLMEAQVLEKAAGTLATVTVRVESHFQVEDKEKFAAWCVKNKRYEFLQARISQGAAREDYKATNKLNPGTNVWTKLALNVRTKIQKED